ITLEPNLTDEDVKLRYPKLVAKFNESFAIFDRESDRFRVSRRRSFLDLQLSLRDFDDSHLYYGTLFEFLFPVVASFTNAMNALIHLPGLRGNPERTYNV